MEQDLNDLIITVRDYSGGYKAKQLGFVKTSTINNCNNIRSEGIRYEAELEPDLDYSYRASKLPVLSIAGKSFERVILSFKEEHLKMAENGLYLIAFSLFDKVGQDWTSNYWRLGFGCSARYGKSEDGHEFKSSNTLDVFEGDFLKLGKGEF
jgi:hypothetical protein